MFALSVRLPEPAIGQGHRGVGAMARARGRDQGPRPSRRMARRREELRLSTAQVAARAGVSQRYLEYLERYPARADATVLRRLAAALQTSPAALLGGAAVTPADGRATRSPVGRAMRRL